MYRHKPNRPHAGTHKPAELLGAHREQPAPQQRPPDVVHDHVQPCSKRRCLCVSAPERRHGQAGRQASRATSPGYTAILALTPATLTCDSLRAARPSTPSSTALAASAQPAQRTMIGSHTRPGAGAAAAASRQTCASREACAAMAHSQSPRKTHGCVRTSHVSQPSRQAAGDVRCS
jgi:hypothetical protein